MNLDFGMFYHPSYPKSETNGYPKQTIFVLALSHLFTYSESLHNIR